MPVIDNFAKVAAELIRLELSMKTQTLTMVNNMEYAEALQNRHGYYVFSDEVSVNQVYDDLKATERALPLTPENVARSLDKSGSDLVAFYRSHTEKLRPPVRPGEGMRQAHPGGWADITGNLSSSTGYRVNGGPTKGTRR